MSSLFTRSRPVCSLFVAAALLAPPPAIATSGPDDPPDNPFLTFRQPQNWSTRVQVDITAFEQNNALRVEIQDWTFETLAVIFPIMRGTAASTADPRDASGELRVADRTFTREFRLIDGYHSDAAYGRWDARELFRVRDIALVYEASVRAWETVFDEQAATRIGWPEGEWPTEARGTFAPQYGVDFTTEFAQSTRVIDERIRQWTEGRDPKSIPPVTLAKFLAGRVLEGVQPTTDGLQRGRSRIRRGFEGFSLQGADRTLEAGRGTPFDMVAALAGVYRRAGLPARIVIGLREFDPFNTRDVANRDELSGATALHAYVEFFLYDEKTGAKGWIPVDIIQLRRQSSRARPLEQPWAYFGTHDELDHFIPLAFHFHPPTTVRAYGSPGLWGWFATPGSPEQAFQRLTFATFNTPVRGGQRPRERD